MKKMLSIILAIVLLLSITACGNKNADIKPINPTESTTQPTDNEEVENSTENTESKPIYGGAEVPEENDKIKMEFVDFDREYLNLEEVSTFDTNISLITFQTNQEIDSEMIEKIETEEAFMKYIGLYGDVEDHSQDTVTIEQSEDGTEFSYSHGWSGAMSSGYKLEFYFLAHPDLIGGYKIDEFNTFFDKENEKMYVVLQKEEYTTDTGKNTCAILYMSLDEEFMSENNIKNISFVLPEKTEDIVLDGSEGNNHDLYEFIKFDRSILNIPEIGMFDIEADWINFPTTTIPEKSILEKFETHTQLLDYLNKYGDVMDHSNDTATIEYDGENVNFNASIGGGMTYSSGFDLEFYFLAHPDIPAGYNIEMDDIYYDETTGNAYIILTKGEYSTYESAKTTCGFMYISFDEDFTKENNLNKIYLVLPE